MSDIGQRLKRERERLGLSQTAFGALGEVKKNAQSNYEQGERSPSAEYLARIAKAGADILYIVTGQPNAGGLSPEEAVLVSGYRAMDARGRSGVLATVAGLTQPAGTTFQIGGSVAQVIQGDATFEGEVKNAPENSTNGSDITKK